ncbi:hypothetical protein ACFFJT_03080 [Dyella flava]|uniref:HEPN domain-containing protein n=1 Tax=Dyella flava TaxID=1920170 RepID=A0ABS2K498_9GAMM|nr:hypothetical protein [Dyella flava]MBM7126014.1 hypothetical protein [Dyella flava]GLQ49186.1 hypothetical protein GCM10010872_06350 [Dyella flava]
MHEDVRLSRALERVIQAQQTLEEAEFSSFLVFESCHSMLAQALAEWMGDKKKAAHWMMIRRSTFQGKSGFELIIEGDIDRLWEHVNVATALQCRSYKAY